MVKVKIIHPDCRYQRVEKNKGKVTYRFGETFETDERCAEDLITRYSEFYEIVDAKPVKPTGGN